MRRLRGLKALIHDAVDRTTELVEEGHESTSRSVMRVLAGSPSLEARARAVDDLRRTSTSALLATIRAVNRATETLTDIGLDLVSQARHPRGGHRRALGGAVPAPMPVPVPMRSDTIKSLRWVGDAALGLVNGVIGDALHARDNQLGLGMTLRHADTYLELDRASLSQAIPQPRPRVAVFVHGLATTEWSWSLESEAYHGDPAASFGSLLARDLDYTPLFARYNSGRHVSENGRLLARELQRFVEAYPGELARLVLVGHSMGGLVIRSACHYATVEGLSWVDELRHVFCLGTPHRGAPLERFGRFIAAALDSVDTPSTRITARVLKGRSAGIKDLRWGALVDEDWQGQDPDAKGEGVLAEIPLLDHVTYHFVSATVTEDQQHPVGRIVGDLLVRVPSAAGPRLERSVFPIETRHYGRVLHHQLQNHPAVYAQLRAACAGD